MSETTDRGCLIWLAPEWQGTAIHQHPKIQAILPKELQDQQQTDCSPVLRPSDDVLKRIESCIDRTTFSSREDFITYLADMFNWALARLPLSEADQHICHINNNNVNLQLIWLRQYASAYLKSADTQ